MNCKILAPGALSLVFFAVALPISAGGEGVLTEDPPHLEVLPPLEPWKGASERIPVASDHPWVTPFEESGMVDSPPYEETVAWLARLAETSDQVEMVPIGESAEGRTLWLVVASREGAASAAELAATGRPVLFAQAGIHSGEIDGKDAGMMLLRDMTVRGIESELLDGASLLFLPVLNVDGHERRSLHGRMNQRGPRHTGWRTTARNLNLNRDYAKADTVEMRALLALLDEWPIDLYLDLHVTDGADYQYDVTFGWNGEHGWSPSVARWLDRVLRPAVSADLESMGHVPGPLVFTVDDLDIGAGIVGWTAPPRFSNGYGDARHLPTVLVENHSLKPYRRRVLGTYVLLESALRVLADEGESLRAAVRADRTRRPGEVPVAWTFPGGSPTAAAATAETIEFRGIEQRLAVSSVTGVPYSRWRGAPVTLDVPYPTADVAAATVSRPTAYWIPSAWSEVIEHLELHGIELERISEPRTVELEMYRLGEPDYADGPFEGRFRVTAPATVERRTVTLSAGSVRVPTDQALGDLAILLLEPASTDSLFQWGFFHEVMSRTEYVEPYVMEPLAAQMLAEDPGFAARYRERLADDPAFRRDPEARLDWFYRQTSYHDERWRLYPVGREVRSPVSVND